MPAGRLIAELSKRTGIRLNCSLEVADDVVLLHVDAVPLSQIMTRIAAVTDARWRWTGSVWQLERTEEMVRAEQERENHAKAAKIAAKQQEMLSALKKPWNAATLKAALPQMNNWLTTGQLAPEIEHIRPLWRAYLHCLSDVSPEDIAQIPPHGRVVFATSPTPQQHPLGKGAQEALTQYQIETKTFNTTLGDVGKRFLESDFGSMGFGQNDSNASPNRILLIIENISYDSYQCELKLLDKENQEIVSKRIDESEFSLVDYTSQTQRLPKSPTVPLSHRSKVLWSIPPRTDHRKWPFIVLPPHPSAEAKEILCNPEWYEPLGMTITDGYLALAKTKKRNLIAALPDRLLWEGSLISPTPFTLNDVQHWPEYGPKMHIIDRDDWITVIPPDPYQARQERVDRAILGKVCRRVAKAGKLMRTDDAELLAHSGDGATYHFCADYLWALSGGEHCAYGPLVLSLYGSLTDEQRQMLLAGNEISYGSLTPLQHFFAEKAVYGTHTNYSEEGKGPASSGELWNEPTQFWPEGLPSTAEIRAQVKRKTIVYLLDPGKPKDERVFWRMYDPPITSYSGPPARIPREGFDVVRYEIHYQNTLKVSVDITPWCRLSEEYDEDIEPAVGPPVSLDKLPPKLREQVKEEIPLHL